MNSWRFCPGELNPADILSRGSRGPELAESQTWWNGADFLKHLNEKWPTEPGVNETEEKEAKTKMAKPKTQPTITRSLATSSNKVKYPNIKEVMDCRRYSSKTKLLRVTAYVIRCIDNARKRQSATGELTAEELKTAEKLWISFIQ